MEVDHRVEGVIFAEIGIARPACFFDLVEAAEIEVCAIRAAPAVHGGGNADEHELAAPSRRRSLTKSAAS